MAKRRTPEEQWEHLQEQAERARRRLARARDPRVEEVERVLTGLSRLMNDEAWPTDQERNTIAALEAENARLKKDLSLAVFDDKLAKLCRVKRSPTDIISDGKARLMSEDILQRAERGTLKNETLEKYARWAIHILERTSSLKAENARLLGMGIDQATRLETLAQFYKDARAVVDGLWTDKTPIEALRLLRSGYDNVCADAKGLRESSAAARTQETESMTHNQERGMGWARDYPAWVCSPCGEKYGRGWTKGHFATWHFDVCGVCGEEASVTEPRDFGHLRDDWRALRARDERIASLEESLRIHVKLYTDSHSVEFEQRDQIASLERKLDLAHEAVRGRNYLAEAAQALGELWDGLMAGRQHSYVVRAAIEKIKALEAENARLTSRLSRTEELWLKHTGEMVPIMESREDAWSENERIKAENARLRGDLEQSILDGKGTAKLLAIAERDRNRAEAIAAALRDGDCHDACEAPDKCERCGKPATHDTADWVPLCKACYDALSVDPSPAAQDRRETNEQNTAQRDAGERGTPRPQEDGITAITTPSGTVPLSQPDSPAPQATRETDMVSGIYPRRTSVKEHEIIRYELMSVLEDSTNER